MPVRSKTLALALAVACGVTGCLDRSAMRPSVVFVQSPWVFDVPDVGYALPNGMRVVIIPDFTTNLIEVGMRYRVGHIDDPEQRSGLAHLVEHLLFLQRVGGETQPTLAERQRALAISYNAVTSLDYTHYQTIATTDDLPRILELEQQRMSIGCVAIDEASFQREREVVRNEIRERAGGADAVINRWILELGYHEDHPYRRAGLGDDEQLAAITYGEACAFIRTHYGPSRATLIVTGPVLPRDVKQLVDKRFGSIPRGNRPAPARVNAVGMPRNVVTRSLDVTDPAVYFVWSGYEPGSPIAAAQRAVVFQQQISMAIALKEADLISTFQLGRRGGDQAPLYVLAVRPWARGDVDRIVALATEEAKEALEAPSFGLMSLYVLNEYFALLSSFESLAGRSLVYGDAMQFDSAEHAVDGKLGQLTGLSELDMNVALRAARRGAEPSVLIVVPDDNAPARYATAALQYQPTEQPEAAHRRMVDLGEAHRPLELPPARTRTSAVKRFRLDNGLEVLLLPSHWIPTLEARLVFRSGSAADPPERAGLAYLAAALVSLPEDADDWHEVLLESAVGTTSWLTVEDDYTELGVRGLQPFAEDIVAAIAEWAIRGRYDAEDLTELKKETVRRSTRGRRRTVGAEYYAALLGDEHPFARLADATATTVATLGTDELASFRAAHFAPANAALVITGSFDATAIEQLIRERFGAWLGGAPPAAPKLQPPVRTAPIYLAAEVADAASIELWIGFSLPSGKGDAMGSRAVVIEMLELQLEAVRAELAASYGLQVSLTSANGVSAIEIEGQLDPARAGEALALVHAKLDAMRRGDDLAADFIYARRAVARRWLAQLSSLEAAAYQLAFAARTGLAPDVFSELAPRVAALLLSDVQSVIARDLAPEREVIMIGGPRQAVDAAYAAIGVTEVRYVR